MSDPFLPERDTPPRRTRPWGFRILLVLAALYLLWRLIQGIGWLIERIAG